MTLGISKYASSALGDVIYIELPELDLEVGSGDAVGAVESVKSASDILTPFAGKVVENNTALEETPSLLNKDPRGRRVDLQDRGHRFRGPGQAHG